MPPPPIERDAASGLDQVVIKNSEGATATVFLHGAHVTSWTVGGKEQLFLSKEAVFKPPKAIRGGIPICWPQFSDLGPLGQHGFARNSTWAVEGGSEDSVVLVLKSSEETKKVFDFDFVFRYTVAVESKALKVSTAIDNTGSAPFSFTYALHTYFGVSAIEKGTVAGLQGCEYLDSLQGRVKVKEEPAEVVFDKEVDRIYLATPDELAIVDAGTSTKMLVKKTSSLPDAVVWNPWVDKSKSMGDFGDEEYKGMVCVEAGIMGKPAEVAAGASFSAEMVLQGA